MPTFLYLLRDRSQPVFKIGIATSVASRASALPDDFDWAASRCARFPTRAAALKVEKLLHHFLAGYQVSRSHHGDGHSEWFQSAAMEAAVNLLESQQSLFQCSALLPVTPPAVAVVKPSATPTFCAATANRPLAKAYVAAITRSRELGDLVGRQPGKLVLNVTEQPSPIAVLAASRKKCLLSNSLASSTGFLVFTGQVTRALSLFISSELLAPGICIFDLDCRYPGLALIHEALMSIPEC